MAERQSLVRDHSEGRLRVEAIWKMYDPAPNLLYLTVYTILILATAFLLLYLSRV